MILKALADYYERMLNDPDCDVAPPGWFHGRLDYVIVLDNRGNYKGIKTLQTEENGRRNGRRTLLPYIGNQALKHTNSGKDANLLWDNATFVLGLGNKGEIKMQSFITAIQEYLGEIHESSVQSVLAFLQRELEVPDAYLKILSHQDYGEEIGEGRVYLSFQIDADDTGLVFQRAPIQQHISNISESESPVGTCLVTGEQNTPIERCHVVIKNIYKAKKDPNFTSFNKPSFTSFGKEQSLNSPVSKKTSFAYTTALNHLLRKESTQQFPVGDASTVFWAKGKHAFEGDFAAFLGEPTKGTEPDYGRLRSLLSAVRTGALPKEDDMPFYVLGIAPNAARIAVRFWYEGNVHDLKEKIAQHFEDIEMIRPSFAKEFLSLRQLLLATTRHSTKYPFGEDGDISPNLGGEVFRSVINGVSYPRTLLQKVVNRIKAEEGLCDKEGRQLDNVTHVRAALIKGFLVREARNKGLIKKEVGKMLDTSYDNIGYVLGRLFAVLEKIQLESHTKEGQKRPDLNKTIRDTYFSAATSSPQVIFKRLQELAVHHLAKIRNSGKSTVWLDKLMGEVMGKVPAVGVPATLALEDQGRFAVGYYHQRQNFFNSNKDENKGE